MGSPTRPEGIEFKPVSPAYIRVRIIANLMFWPFLAALGLVIGYMWHLSGYVLAAVSPVIFLWRLYLVPRQVRAIGYYEGESEFLITRGIMFRELTVIPYGRIQYVEINEGPVATHYGIAEITLHTASTETAGRLDGLPLEEASRLRDALSRRGAVDHVGL